MKRVAIIGAGITGMSAAYTLSKNNVKVDIFDADKAQGTKAAVGIICPWLSQRRNKHWYALACDGATYLNQLAREIEGQTFYKQNGTLLFHETRLDKMMDLAIKRKGTPTMGDVKMLQGDTLKTLIPSDMVLDKALWVSGGAQLDGKDFCETMLAHAPNATLIKKQVVLNDVLDYDAVIVAAGPWINTISDRWEFDVHAQKGQCIEFENHYENVENYPVFMPQGQTDILFNHRGLVIGASHEKEKGFDDTRDLEVEAQLLEDAQKWIPSLKMEEISGYRVGSRAFTSDFTPFYGPVEGFGNVYVASGLGSSGLTTGPIIGYRLAKAILGDSFDFSELSPSKYQLR